MHKEASTGWSVAGCKGQSGITVSVFLRNFPLWKLIFVLFLVGVLSFNLLRRS